MATIGLARLGDDPTIGITMLVSGGIAAWTRVRSPHRLPSAAMHGDPISDPRVLVAAANLRDLGGLTTTEGLRVRTGLLFRAGYLCDLDGPDRDVLDSLGIRTILDLRRPTEVAARPHPEMDGVEIVQTSVSSDDNEFAVLANAMLDPDSEPLGPDHIAAYFRGNVTDRLDRYRPVFEAATDPGRYPLLFNCTAGKDRTGFVAGILLRLLGVDEPTVLDDYMLSNAVRRGWIAEREDEHRLRIAESLGVPPDEVPETRLEASRALLNCDRHFLKAALDAVHDRWGSWEAFRRDGLGLDDGRFAAYREALLG